MTDLPKTPPKLFVETYAARYDDMPNDVRWVKDVDSAVDLAVKTGMKFIEVYTAESGQMNSVLEITNRKPLFEAHVGYDKLYSSKDELLAELRALPSNPEERLTDVFAAKAEAGKAEMPRDRREALIATLEAGEGRFFIWDKTAPKGGTIHPLWKMKVFGTQGELVYDGQAEAEFALKHKSRVAKAG